MRARREEMSLGEAEAMSLKRISPFNALMGC
jgi:hypothetical protein